ncbi:unnamed protein product [Rhizophagus irregularis]|nr:unnamed protein product [Rhizophagus irregularis]
MIKNWRVGEENSSDQNDTSENKGQQLKKDNVAPEEVVEIIKDYRTTNKIKYVQYQESTHDGSLVDKLKEVKDIFNQTSNEMEWEKINIEAATRADPIPSVKEDKEEEEEEELEPKASPSKKNSGSGKKKKKKNNKK